MLKVTERVRGEDGIRHEPPPSHTKVWEGSIRILEVWVGRKPEWGSWDSHTYLSLEDKWQGKKSKERGGYLTPSRGMRKLDTGPEKCARTTRQSTHLG